LLFIGLSPQFVEQQEYFVQCLQNSSRKIFLIIKQQGRNTYLNSYSTAAPSNSLNIFLFVLSDVI